MNAPFQLLSVLFTLSLLAAPVARAKVVEYNFNIDYKTVNFTGKNVRAMAVGGAIPAPTIEATVGDTLRVTFNNKMAVESSIHWHGVLLPNDQDGVPYLTTPPIMPGTSFTYEFPVIHPGTYWYHSHTGLQEQRGVYGALVFHPRQGGVEADRDMVVVLSDWTDENPNRVMHNLKKSDAWYALKKDSVQSWLKVLKQGSQAIKNRLDGAWTRMGPMDISDVGYDAFLANGQKQHRIPDIKPGDRVRLRVINAAASSYFHIQYAGGPMTIVSADGVDVEPVTLDRQRLAIAETFDVIVTAPDDRGHEFRATSEDGTGYSSVILGEGVLVKAPDIPRPNPFLAAHSMHRNTGQGAAHHSGTGHMNHRPRRMDEYELLRATGATQYHASHATREVRIELTGDMERYAWSFDNRVLSEADKILIRKGEVVRFVMANRTMMHHPVHLHGHFFRVLNGQDEYSPLKHTLNVPAMQTVTIEFLANEEKDWLFHCHNLYHMKSGMTRVISYEGTTQATPDSMRPLFADRHWFYFADIAAQNNFSQGVFRAENTRNAFDLEYEWDYGDNYEIELVYERYINRFVELYLGGEFEQEKERFRLERETLGIAGAHYLLPLLIAADIRVDSNGHGRLGLSSELQLTDRLSFDWSANTDSEYRLQLEYELSKQLVITGGRDDQFDWGIGLELRF